MSDNVTREPYRNAWYKQLQEAIKQHEDDMSSLRNEIDTDIKPNLVPEVIEGDDGKVLKVKNNKAEWAEPDIKTVEFEVDNTVSPATSEASLTYAEVQSALASGSTILAKYSEASVPASGIPIEDKNFYIQKMAAVGITLNDADFDGYNYSFLIEMDLPVTNAEYGIALYLLKYDKFVLKGAFNDNYLSNNTFYIMQLGGGNDDSGIGFIDATWNNGDTVARIISYHPNTTSAIYTNSYLTATNNASMYGNQYMYSSGYVSNMNYRDTLFPRYLSPDKTSKLYIGSNTTLYRADTSTYQSYGTLLGELTEQSATNIHKLISSSTITTELITAVIEKISYNDYILFVFVDENNIKFLKYNSDGTFTLSDGLVSSKELPAATSADVGKVLTVDANGNYVLATPT